jgi:trans-2-enoyl-CoA reductase
MAMKCAVRPSATLRRELGVRVGFGSKQSSGSNIGNEIGRRWKSGPYGYTQAKALVYSKYGEPSDVLS